MEKVAGILRNGPNKLSILDFRWLTHDKYDLGGFPPLQPASVRVLDRLLAFLIIVTALEPGRPAIYRPAATPSFF
jgi:hypothetical protein